LHRGNHWLIQVKQWLTKPGLRTLTRAWRVFKKILDIVARTERVSRGIADHHMYFIVLCCLVDGVCQIVVHRRRHGILSRRPIDSDPNDTSRPLSNNVTHGLPLFPLVARRSYLTSRLTHARLPCCRRRLRTRFAKHSPRTEAADFVGAES